MSIIYLVILLCTKDVGCSVVEVVVVESISDCVADTVRINSAQQDTDSRFMGKCFRKKLNSL